MRPLCLLVASLIFAGCASTNESSNANPQVPAASQRSPRTDSSGLAFLLENTQHFTGIVGAEFEPSRNCVAAVNPAGLINVNDQQKAEIHITADTTGACKDADRKARFELVYLAIGGIRSFVGTLTVTYEAKRGIWIGKIQKTAGHSEICTTPTGFDTGVKLESYDVIKFGFCS